MKYLISYNESVRDLMKPKSEEEIVKALGKMTPEEKLEKGSRHNILSLVKQGIKEGANIEWGNHLSYALIHGNLEMVKLLVDNGVDLQPYKSGHFYQACRRIQFLSAEILLIRKRLFLWQG